jgi:5-methylcytosine-specific restriction endonuclease McrA
VLLKPHAEAAESSPVPSADTSTVAMPMNAGVLAGSSNNASQLVPGRAEATVSAPAAVVPLAPERYKIQFTANAATRDKLRRAQELLRHRVPSGDLAQVVDLALESLLRDLEKKKTAATDRPRGVVEDGKTAPARATATASRKASRHVPAAVRRAVWERDGGRCTFLGATGARCAERGWIEFDHRWPHGDGGTATVDNVRLLCRSHNQHEARNYFGVWEDDGREGARGRSIDGRSTAALSISDVTRPRTSCGHVMR